MTKLQRAERKYEAAQAAWVADMGNPEKHTAAIKAGNELSAIENRTKVRKMTKEQKRARRAGIRQFHRDLAADALKLEFGTRTAGRTQAHTIIANSLTGGMA